MSEQRPSDFFADRADEVAAVAKDLAATAQAKAGDFVAAAQPKVGEFVSAASDKANDVAKSAKSKAGDAYDTMRDNLPTSSEAEKQVRTKVKGLRSKIKSKPITAAVIALVIGFMLAKLTSRSSD